MLTYLLVIFPYGSYGNVKGIMNALSITGKYKRVIDDNMPVYLKDKSKHQIFCIDHSRFRQPKIAVSDMVNSLSNKRVDIIRVVTDKPSEWLKKNGYETETTEEVPDEKLLYTVWCQP